MDPIFVNEACVAFDKCIDIIDNSLKNLITMIYNEIVLLKLSFHKEHKHLSGN